MDAHVYQEAGRRVAGWPRTLVLTHQRPDADALGAMAGMTRVLRALGLEATAFIYDEIAPRYQFLDAIGDFQTWQHGEPAAIDGRFDGILILDTCSWSQLDPVADYLRASRLPKVVLDHHATRDDLSVNGTDDYYAIDLTSSSDCGLVYEWCEAMGWPIDEPAGEAILTGIAGDTGWFRFSNTDGRTLRAAAALLEHCQVRPEILYARLYAAHSPARLRLMTRMLETLQFHADGRLAVVELTKAMFDQAGARPDDAEELVNIPMETHSVVVCVLLTDMGEGVVRLNFRSKSPELVGRTVDVSAVAGTFGGGGHHRAAGARVPGRLDEVRDRAIAAITEALE
ncbi:MAG: DHH family phosphoesterase [Planctomycetes bacterium]|nr:DHH family phosphoesterase [Planctomycetota bacterium]